jgi:hypothetical protein
VAKNLSITIKVTDANLHTFSKSFDFTITNIDDTAPTDIQLSNDILIKGQVAESVPKLVLAAVFSAMLRLFMKVMSVGDSSLRSVKVTTNT